MRSTNASNAFNVVSVQVERADKLMDITMRMLVMISGEAEAALTNDRLLCSSSFFYPICNFDGSGQHSEVMWPYGYEMDALDDSVRGQRPRVAHGPKIRLIHSNAN
ncbi:U4 [Hyposoter didymator ichnovirus]|nr:U4 [Hyposoter didymator ichnovirus]